MLRWVKILFELISNESFCVDNQHIIISATSWKANKKRFNNVVNRIDSSTKLKSMSAGYIKPIKIVEYQMETNLNHLKYS